MNQMQKLEIPFKASQISWRVGATNAKKNNGKATKGIALAYIDARDVIKRLNQVVGKENWQTRYPHVTAHGVVCEIGIRINDEWIWKANGAGETQVEAEKGAMSDAFKRAAVLWGVGTYLYQLPNVWVDVNQYGQIEKPPTLPAWATPEGYMEMMKKREAA